MGISNNAAMVSELPMLKAGKYILDMFIFLHSMFKDNSPSKETCNSRMQSVTYYIELCIYFRVAVQLARRLCQNGEIFYFQFYLTLLPSIAPSTYAIYICRLVHLKTTKLLSVLVLTYSKHSRSFHFFILFSLYRV